MKLKKRMLSFMRMCREIIVKNKIINHLSRWKSFYGQEEANELIFYLKNHKLDYFNYDFVELYNKMDIKVFHDLEKNLPYVYYNDKKMYMKKNWSKQQIVEYTRFLLMEQDERSPHLYLDNELKAKNCKCIIDGGGAEGIFSLDMIEKCENIIIFECDEEWVTALEATFENYKDKVQIVKKYISNYDNDNVCTLDNIVEKLGYEIDLIKLDIEGEELNGVKGSKRIFLNNPNVVLLLCTYHYKNEEDDIRRFFENYQILNRQGYIYFKHEPNQKPPYFRRGVLKIEK